MSPYRSHQDNPRPYRVPPPFQPWPWLLALAIVIGGGFWGWFVWTHTCVRHHYAWTVVCHSTGKYTTICMPQQTYVCDEWVKDP